VTSPRSGLSGRQSVASLECRRRDWDDAPKRDQRGISSGTTCLQRRCCLCSPCSGSLDRDEAPRWVATTSPAAGRHRAGRDREPPRPHRSGDRRHGGAGPGHAGGGIELEVAPVTRFAPDARCQCRTSPSSSPSHSPTRSCWRSSCVYLVTRDVRPGRTTWRGSPCPEIGAPVMKGTRTSPSA
jgi:hypothetical protein